MRSHQYHAGKPGAQGEGASTASSAPPTGHSAVIRAIVTLCVVVGSSFWSCQESLPGFDVPSRTIVGKIIASYTYGVDNMLTVSLAIENTFDETLQNVSVMSGVVRITPHANPTYSRTLTLGPNSIVQANNYNPITKVLTFDPGEVIWMQAKWNFIDDRLRDLRDSVFVYVEDPTCSARRIAHRQGVTIEASVIVFEQIGHVLCPPVELSFCHIDRFISVRDCPPIDPDSACNLVEP